MREQDFQRLRDAITSQIDHYENRSLQLPELREQSLYILRDVLWHMDHLKEHSDFMTGMQKRENDFNHGRAQ